MRLKKTGIVSLLILTLLVSGMPVAFAASPPTVQTLKPTRMYVDYTIQPADIRATLNGSVNPGGGTCTVYFEYGPTTAYGSVASAGTVSGAGAVNVSAALTGLALNTTYHYRVVAVSSEGAYYGKDLAFLPSCYFYRLWQYPNDGSTQAQLLRYPMTSDPTGNIDIWSASIGPGPNTSFEIYNRNLFPVTIHYSAGTGHTGNIWASPEQTGYIYVPKGSICAFSYNYSLFKQLLTNDRNDYEMLPPHYVHINALGYLGERQGAIYSINNWSRQAATIDLQVGYDYYSVPVPADSYVYFVTQHYQQVMANYNGEAFAAIEPPRVKWHGSAFVTAAPRGMSDTTAVFELQNNDDTARSVKLKNVAGITHEYTLAAYEHRIVTIEKSDWNLYMQLSPLPQADVAGWVDGGYVKISSVSPGETPALPLTVSSKTVFMGASAGTVTPVRIWGGNAWTALSSQPWLTVSPTSGSGESWLAFTAQANTTSSARSANVTISDGAATQTVTVIQSGQTQDNALSFDGVNDAVSISDNDAGIADAFTLETWVKWEPDSPTAVQFICGKGSEQMELHTGGNANNIRFIPTPGVYLDAMGVLPTGVWTHVAAVYQPSAALAKMYIGGSEVTLTNNGSKPLTSGLTNSTSAFVLGSRGSGALPFKGALDDFRIWNRALTQDEVRLNMVNPFVPSGQTGLVSAYSFNQGVAGMDNAGVTVLTDETGSRNGTLHGFALTGTSSNWVASAAKSAVQSYAVTYDGNGAASGIVPSDPLKYVAGAKATVRAAGGLAKTGGSFGGWNTAPDGSGTTYYAGAIMTMPASDVTLYARWLSGTGKYTVTPAASAAYTAGTTPEGIASMTVNGGVSGLISFPVTVGVTESHTGNETAIFIQFRAGVQIGLKTVTADLDYTANAAADFDVQPGYVVKVYIVDALTNGEDVNPTLLQ